MDRLDAFGERFGFAVEVESDVVRAVGVPCLLKNKDVSRCTIEKSYEPESGRPDKRLGNAVHAVRVCIHSTEAHDGRVYNADGTPIGNRVRGDGSTWADISIRKGSQNSPEDDLSPRDVIYRYAKHIIGAVAASDSSFLDSLTASNIFNIPYFFEERSGIGPVQDRIRNAPIAIIGLGGTGSYILDLIVKTPVEIHLLDFDDLDWHNFMRAPGAPSAEEIESQHREPLGKVGYYHAKYSSLRNRIYAHDIRGDTPAQFAEFLSAHPIDFAFVCIDQLLDSDSPRQDSVYAALSEARIPFIDSGVSITVDGTAIRGAVTTSFYSEGSLEWQDAIPNASAKGGLLGYRNVQLPEVNALAASLAVMEWRRRTGQYVSESPSFLHRFRLETPRIVVPPKE